jgi:pseudouridine synthase
VLDDRKTDDNLSMKRNIYPQFTGKVTLEVIYEILSGNDGFCMYFSDKDQNKVFEIFTREGFVFVKGENEKNTNAKSEKGRATVKDLTADVGARVYPVGRLDLESEGLLLLTNDGELANRLTHPRHEIPKYYLVTVKGEVTLQQRKRLASAMDIDGYTIRPVRNEVISMNDEQTVLKLELFEGRNRQIRKMCEKVDLKVLKLKRIAIGAISLGNLKIGTWRKLSKEQIDYLKVSCGMKK